MLRGENEQKEENQLPENSMAIHLHEHALFSQIKSTIFFQSIISRFYSQKNFLVVNLKHGLALQLQRYCLEISLFLRATRMQIDTVNMSVNKVI